MDKLCRLSRTVRIQDRSITPMMRAASSQTPRAAIESIGTFHNIASATPEGRDATEVGSITEASWNIARLNYNRSSGCIEIVPPRIPIYARRRGWCRGWRGCWHTGRRRHRGQRGRAHWYRCCSWGRCAGWPWRWCCMRWRALTRWYRRRSIHLDSYACNACCHARSQYRRWCGRWRLSWRCLAVSNEGCCGWRCAHCMLRRIRAMGGNARDKDEATKDRDDTRDHDEAACFLRHTDKPFYIFLLLISNETICMYVRKGEYSHLCGGDVVKVWLLFLNRLIRVISIKNQHRLPVLLFIV